ncbi:hypothetical protein ACFPM0_21970 [Pseudonocardia sulfidoxydans]
MVSRISTAEPCRSMISATSSAVMSTSEYGRSTMMTSGRSRPA